MINGSDAITLYFANIFLALLYKINTKHSKIKRSMDTLVTREILINFTTLLHGQMSCNGLSISVVKQPLCSSLMTIKQPIFYYAMDVGG